MNAKKEAWLYVQEIIEGLQRIANDPEKCAEVMAGDQQEGGLGLHSLLNMWADEQWEKDHPDEAERQWAEVDLPAVLDRARKELDPKKKRK